MRTIPAQERRSIPPVQVGGSPDEYTQASGPVRDKRNGYSKHAIRRRERAAARIQTMEEKSA